MKKNLVIPAFVVISLISCKNSADNENEAENISQNKIAYNSYGENFEPAGAISAEGMEEQYENLKPGDTVEAIFQAPVNAVCKNKGCWMTLDLPEQEEDVMVKFKDYGFFVPKDIEEREVLVKGRAFITEVSVDEQRHYAEDKGESPEAIASITQPKRTLSFLAEGVLIKEN